MEEIKIPKSDILPILQLQLRKELEPALKQVGKDAKIDKIEWTSEGLTIFVKR